MQSMDLNAYLTQPDAPSVSELRQRMKSLGYDVKSDAQVRQWRGRYQGRIPSPKNCVGLELATGNAVPRTEFYPDDWRLIWPELAEEGSHA